VHHQYAHASNRRPGGHYDPAVIPRFADGADGRHGQRRRLRDAQFALLGERQRDGERRATSHAFARRLDLAAVELGQMLHQRQPQPKAAAPQRTGRIDLSEAVEDLWQEFRLNALARVADDDPDVFAGAFGPQFDAPAGGCELNRVREQVPADLITPPPLPPYHPPYPPLTSRAP